MRRRSYTKLRGGGGCFASPARAVDPEGGRRTDSVGLAGESELKVEEIMLEELKRGLAESAKKASSKVR